MITIATTIGNTIRNYGINSAYKYKKMSAGELGGISFKMKGSSNSHNPENW